MSQRANRTDYFVRTLINDTDTSDQKLNDLQIEMFLEESGGNPYFAAALACEAIAASFAALQSVRIGDVSVSAGVLHPSTVYQDLAKKLRRRGAVNGARPHAGGLSPSERETAEQDDGRTQPFFERDTHRVRRWGPFEDDDRVG